MILELRQKYKICDLIKVAKLPRSSFYYYCKTLKRQEKYLFEKQEIKNIFHENHGRYGYRRITMELDNRGFHLNHKTVQRLMKELELKCMVRFKKYRSYKGEIGKIAPNILKRDFQSEAPNKKWVTDVTEIQMYGEKLYFSPILDLYNGEIIAYQIKDRPSLQLVTEMMEEVLKTLKEDEKPILHSDQGWQYQHVKYQGLLNRHGIRQSMSRKGNCLDNSVMENFFGLLKSELLYLRSFESMKEFKKELEQYIEYYNNKRIKKKLKGLSPVQYRIQSSLIA